MDIIKYDLSQIVNSLLSAVMHHANVIQRKRVSAFHSYCWIRADTVHVAQTIL